MPSFHTPDRHGYSVQFSPFLPQRLACAACQYYGIAGGGSLFVLDVAEDSLRPVQVFEYSDGLFDVAWAENNENILVAAAGDGSIQVWDVLQPKGPLKILKEHTKEVNSVHWSQTRNDNLVVSASWDNLIKVWDINESQSGRTYVGHSHIVYDVVWSPQLPGTFASASGDRTLRVWDIRGGDSCTVLIQAHSEEILSCDWCKYDSNQVFSGSVDGLIRGWDLRSPRLPFCELRGHRYAVKRIRTSPFLATSLASSSYDFSVRTWDIAQEKTLEVIEHHSEFVYGLDFNLHVPGQIADCAWDGVIHVYQPQSCISP
ncbi:hypothetical protein ACOMHN_019122 [Nucella lapillus]